MDTFQCTLRATCALAMSTGLATARPFTTVLNIGTDPGAGVVFDGVSVGGGSGIVTPDNLSGNMLGSDSQLNLYDGGDILPGFIAGQWNASSTNIEVNVYGGSVGGTPGGEFRPGPGSTINILGGSINNILAFNSTLNISGGSFLGQIVLIEPGTFNVFGTAFFLDGVELTGLVPGQAFAINQNGAPFVNDLSGVFADGSMFSFFVGGFDGDPTITVTLIPAPGAAALLAGAGAVAVRRRRG